MTLTCIDMSEITLSASNISRSGSRQRAHAALGSLSGGLIHDLHDGYDGIVVFALISVIVGMIPFLVMPDLR